VPFLSQYNIMSCVANIKLTLENLLSRTALAYFLSKKALTKKTLTLVCVSLILGLNKLERLPLPIF
jgi:hypothetical protein